MSTRTLVSASAIVLASATALLGYRSPIRMPLSYLLPGVETTDLLMRLAQLGLFALAAHWLGQAADRSDRIAESSPVWSHLAALVLPVSLLLPAALLVRYHRADLLIPIALAAPVGFGLGMTTGRFFDPSLWWGRRWRLLSFALLASYLAYGIALDWHWGLRSMHELMLDCACCVALCALTTGWRVVTRFT